MRTDASLAGGLGLALLGTSCCALPITLVALGLGGVVASLVAAAPWLVWLSHYKGITFTFTALVLAYSGWRLRKARLCDPASGRRRKWQQRILRLNAALLAASLFAAYALLPLVQWLKG
ncbi:hypothetical protein [Microbulbifer magnicolonia]|uniref:hypothetical protein n=1 Tax=Microbulbifer magnicolonia TaxID=3109744 RepID=UPI002B4050E8|nr:hypothetical protein [Microbulbifer sp. GG15]